MTSVPVARGPKGVKLRACNDGFTGTDVTDDFNVNAECTNNDNSFSCACKTGYNGNSTFCTHIDECATITDNCDANAACKNNDESYECTCNNGYNY